MSTVITRHNGFILDHKDPKKGYAYSCPNCYAITYYPQAMTSAGCKQCGFTGNVYTVPANGNAVPTNSAPNAVAVIAYSFRVAGRNSYGNIDITCMKCGSHHVSKGSFGVKGPVDKAGCCTTGFINWEEYCNTCLCIHGSLVKASYVCSDNNKNHPKSITMPATVTRVGKCRGCVCTVSCKQI